MAVCEFTAHNNEKCETILNEWWCVNLHHITNDWLFMCACFLRLLTLWLQIAVYGCMNVAWGLRWGESRSTKPCVFLCRVAAAGDERYLVCAAGAAAVVSRSNRFLLCVLQHVVVHLCVVLCACRLSGCRSQCNGRMNVSMLCCHVRGEMRVSHVMLQNALASVWGESRSTKLCFFV